MRSLIVTTIAATFAALCGLYATPVSAEQRALLVGVGKYRVPGHDLPAIDLDLDRMQHVLNLMGFEDSQIRRLLDEQATSRNVTREMKRWLVDGVEEDDRVVFYYSGHGSFNADASGDEADMVDEVLVTHDVSFSNRNGQRTLNGVVDDDTLSALIAAIPSKNVWVIIDACHSGTATRNFTMDNQRLGTGQLVEKSFVYAGMPSPKSKAYTRSIGANAGNNFVSLAAAGDQEQAIGTLDGGIFTMGLWKAIDEAARTGSSLTVHDLREFTAEFIRASVDPGRVHTPQVEGNPALASGSLDIIPLRDGNGPNRKKLVQIVADTDRGFEFKSNAGVYQLGTPLKLDMTIPIDGYLNVVTVDSKDDAIVLFPNSYHADNKVTKGRFAIPTDKMTFELPASEPLGPTLLVGFVTRERINFYEQNLDQRDADGTINVDFSKVSATATRAFKVAPKDDGKYASHIEVSVVR
ncbi:MAG: caspase family protein [Gammaproteobacteria bacterium]|nr:caspase family protein [Gammaproteobacteria bacterium]